MDQDGDGKYDDGDVVYVIVPANGAMLTALGNDENVEALIVGDDGNDSSGGAAA